MLDVSDQNVIVRLPVDILVDEVFGDMQPRAVDVGEGGIRAFQGNRRSRNVTIVAFDPARDHGAIGRAEAAQLVRAIGMQELGSVLIFVMNTSGILVTDSTHGIASLRKVLREAEDARLRGVRMIALIVKQAFGGASILAGLCERRIIHPGALFAMSGPRLIEQTVGRNTFDSRDRAQVEQLLGGSARASMSSGFVCVAASVAAYRTATLQWLDDEENEPITLSSLVTWGRRLEARLARPIPPPVPVATDASPLDSAALGILDAIDPSGYELLKTGQIVIARPRSTSRTMVFALVAREGCGFHDAVALGLGLLNLEERFAPGSEVAIIVDSESHAATAADERFVLSEALAFLALAIRWLSVRCRFDVQVVVSGVGGGGIQGALGSAANSVAMGAGAQLRVLPSAAMRALNKSEDSEAGSIAMAIAVGAVDGEFAGTRMRPKETTSHVGE